MAQTVQMRAQSHNRKTLEPSKGVRKVRASNDFPMIHASTAHLWSATEKIYNLQAWDLDIRIQGSQNSPTSANAKWRAKISTRASINLIHKHALKTVLWAQAHMNKSETSSDGINISDKTSCTSSVNRFMRLIPLGDNPKKRKPSSIYHIPHVSINWVRTTWVVHNNS